MESASYAGLLWDHGFASGSHLDATWQVGTDETLSLGIATSRENPAVITAGFVFYVFVF